MDLLQISQNIRTIRNRQNMTLEQLARKSGFSKGFLSQVENFRVTPSLHALNRIAAALGVPLNGLFADETLSPEYSFGRLDAGEEMTRDDNLRFGMRYFALAHTQIGRMMDPFVVEYDAGKEERAFLMHDSEEIFLVLEGSIDFFLVHDGAKHTMKPGELLYMKANLPHRAVPSPGCPHAKALIVYARNSE